MGDLNARTSDAKEFIDKDYQFGDYMDEFTDQATDNRKIYFEKAAHDMVSTDLESPGILYLSFNVHECPGISIILFKCHGNVLEFC